LVFMGEPALQTHVQAQKKLDLAVKPVP
jgi:hypothetical protein